MARPLHTRADLRRALVVNALTKPLNVLVPAIVVVIGAALGAGWLAIVALVCWVALAGVTFFDEREAVRVGERRRAHDRPEPAPSAAGLSPEIGERLEAAIAAQESIRGAVAASGLPLADILGEVDSLVAAMEGHAARAERIHGFLAARPPHQVERRIAEEQSPAVKAALETQLGALRRLQGQQEQLLAEMDHVVATLDTVHAEVLAADGLDDAPARRAVASQVVELRTNVQLVSAGLEEAFEETRARLGP